MIDNRAVDHVPLHLWALDRVGKRNDALIEDTKTIDARRFVGAREQHLHPDTDTEERDSCCDSFVGDLIESDRADRLGTRAERSDAGQHDTVGCGDHGRVTGQHGVGAGVREPFVGRVQVADPVVEDRDRGFAHDPPRSEGALGGGQRVPFDPHGIAQRSSHSLEVRLDDVMRVLAAAAHDVQGDSGRHHEGAPELLDQLRIERRIAEDLLAWKLDLVVQVGTTREVEHDLDGGFVERDTVRCEPANASLVAPGHPEGLPERDPDVFDRVVGVDLEIARGVDLEIEAPVTTKLVKHVAEEGQAGLDVGLTGAIEIERNVDLGLLGGALVGSSTAHVRTSVRASRNRSSSSGVPIVTRRQP